MPSDSTRRATLWSTAALTFAVSAVAGPAEAAVPTCYGARATIVGTAGADRIVGTDGTDVIVALGGDDVVIAGDGLDIICAGRGSDRVRAGGGDDLVDGGGGADALLGQSGDDLLIGGRGDDLVRAGPQDDYACGDLLVLDPVPWCPSWQPGGGDDRMLGSAGHDVLLGGAGSDLLNSGNGQDLVSGDHGDDDVQAGRGDDVVLAFMESISAGIFDGGRDTVDLGDGDDLADAGDLAPNDAISGRRGEDVCVVDADGDAPAEPAACEEVVLRTTERGDTRTSALAEASADHRSVALDKALSGRGVDAWPGWAAIGR